MSQCAIYFYRLDYPLRENQRNLSDEDMRLLRAAIRKAGFGGSREERIVNMVMQETAEGEGDFSAYGHRGLLSSGRDIRGTFIAQALTAILITVSPDLVSMSLAQPFYTYPGYYKNPKTEADSARRWAGVNKTKFPLTQFLYETNASPENKPYLQNLRSVYVIPTRRRAHYGLFYREFDFRCCFVLLNNLLSIESVATDSLEEDENGLGRVRLGPTNFTRISIHNSIVDQTYLGGLIVSCKVLREFRYSTGGRPIPDSMEYSFDPKTFVKALCAHKETLEVLDVGAEEQFDWNCFPFRNMTDENLEYEELDAEEWEAEFAEYGGPSEFGEGPRDIEFLKSIWENSGSLKDFVSLKRLSLRLEFLLYFARGVRGRTVESTRREVPMLAVCLPDSLEYLCIPGYQAGEDEEHDIQIDALVAFYKSGLSSLKEIEVIEEDVPHAEDVHNPNGDPDLSSSSSLENSWSSRDERALKELCDDIARFVSRGGSE